MVTQKVQSRALQPGDQVGSGETVMSVSAGLLTPRGKVEVVLEKNGRTRMSLWGAYTLINITRGAANA
jgi:hypothetical protein